MSLNTSGGLLEGIRLATGNNPFTYPPRSIVVDQGQLDAIPYPSEYMLFVEGQAAGSSGIDIGSPDLKINWSRNDGTVLRFDFDAYSRRWNTNPGSSPDSLGKFGNSPRLKMTPPDPSVPFAEAPYSVYIGHPTRIVTFTISTVRSSMDFTDPPAGTVQLSLENGELNFGTADLANASYVGSTVMSTRQSFFDRSKSNGAIGSLPDSPTTSYKLLLNPIPGSGQLPRIRIGYRRYLTPIGYATEDVIVTPPAGSFAFSYDVGRVVFSTADIAAYAGETVYYDGVIVGSSQLTRTTIGPVSFTYPVACGTFAGFINPTDQSRYVLFIEPPSGQRFYLVPTFFNSLDGMPDRPSSGHALVDVTTGSVYVSPDDSTLFPSGQVKVVDTYLQMEHGVAVQLYRSSVNAAGYEQVPDFVETYSVNKQVVQDGINAPFVFLPTVPIVDSSLEYVVTPAPGGGSFTGQLVDGTDPNSPGLGYLLDLDSKRFKFSNRKTTSMSLQKSTSMVKLDDAAISPSGIQITRNSLPIKPGVDFDFNPTGGLIEFVEPVGENDSRNILSLSGSTVLPNTFKSLVPAFSTTSIGASIIISSGINAGVYRITGYVSPTEVVVSKAFKSAASESVDVRFGIETVADRFFVDLKPPYRKITIRRMQSFTGPSSTLTQDEFSVVAQTGQINLVKAARPGEIFQVDYVWLESTDNGITVTPKNVTEYAAFKIRQETATIVPGTGTIHFNPSGKTVATYKPITLYIDGVPVDAENFTFTAPGTITVSNLLTTESVVVDYFVNEAPGGNQTFTLTKSPVDLDRPQIVAGQETATFNGDVRNIVSAGSSILADGRDLFLVSSVSYDPDSDSTTVTFDPVPEIDTGFAPLKVSGPVNGDFSSVETNPVDTIPKGSSTVSIQGRAPYSAGTVLTIDGDPFLALSAAYDQASDRTNVTLAAKTSRNYIIPSVTRTIRPVFNPGSDFTTAKPAHVGYPFTLFRDGSSPKLLTAGIDYTVAEGGVIKTNFTASHGDVLYAFYVARKPQPAGTSFTFNYAHEVAPDQANGLQGQRLEATYNLYSPDTFFYRTSTVLAFIPEVVNEFKKSASGGTSGPNIASKTSLRTKDQGSPSLYFDEQHFGNVDIVIRRLLKFYNDLVNQWEDILTDFDGRVVGGINGRFRYNDLSTTVTDYASITNDIDDRVKLFDRVTLVSLNPITFQYVPFYKYMYEPNSLSRLFPTVDPFVTVALNGNVAPIVDYGKTLGSLGIDNVTAVSTMTSSRAVAEFTSATVVGPNTNFVIQKNGDPEGLIPQFAPGQKVFVYNPDGSPFTNIPKAIASVTGTGPYIVTVSGVTFPGQTGSLIQDTSDTNVASNHFYTPGRDLAVDPEHGQLKNNYFQLPLIGTMSVPIAGEELVDCSVTFVNSSTTPRRIPALDGSVLADNGRISVPPLNRVATSETYLLDAEQDALTKIGSATVMPDLVTINMLVPIPYTVGMQIVFLAGPNAGAVRTISVAISPVSFQVSSSLPSADPVGHDLNVFSVYGSIYTIVSGELAVIGTNVATPPVPPALIGTVDSELISLNSVITGMGQQQASGTGTALVPNVLTDLSADFVAVTPPITPSSFLYVPSGTATGLYKIASITTTTITVDPLAPYPTLPAGGPYSYQVIAPWSFLSTKGAKLASEMLAKTKAFYDSTVAWYSSMSLAGVPARQAAVAARKSDVASFIARITGLLKADDRLYDTRFLWIQQRTDKKDGTLTQQVLARQRRMENTAKLIMNQQKLLIANSLV